MKVCFVVSIRDSDTDQVDLHMYKMGQLLDDQVCSVLQQDWELVDELRLPDPMLTPQDLKRKGDVEVTCETYYSPVYCGVVVWQKGMYVNVHGLPFTSSSEDVSKALTETGWAEITKAVRGLIE